MIETLDIKNEKIKAFYEDNNLPILQIDYNISLGQIAVAVESPPANYKGGSIWS